MKRNGWETDAMEVGMCITHEEIIPWWAFVLDYQLTKVKLQLRKSLKTTKDKVLRPGKIHCSHVGNSSEHHNSRRVLTRRWKGVRRELQK